MAARAERGSLSGGSPLRKAGKAPEKVAAGMAGLSLADSKESNEFKVLADKTPAKTLVAPGVQLLEVGADDDLLEAFQRIVARKVLSAPVWDASAKQYIGFLDTRDLTQYVTFMQDEKEKNKEKAGDKLQPPEVELRSIFDAAARMFPQKQAGITIKYLAKRNRFVGVSADDSVLKVVGLMCQSDVHRVAVLDDKTGRCTSIISQSSIVKFIHENREQMKTVLSPTVQDVQLGSRPVIPVKDTDTALEAFRIMAKYNRSGIAVVDKDGRFVGNTSGSDLKLFIQNPQQNAKTLEVPVMDFLAAIRRTELQTKSPTIVVTSNDSIETVVGKLFATRVHRVFVAEDAKGFKPEAVISLTDVLNHLLRAEDPTKVKVDAPIA